MLNFLYIDGKIVTLGRISGKIRQSAEAHPVKYPKNR